MKKPPYTLRSPVERRFERAMIESTDLLGETLSRIEFEDPDDFLLFELAQSIEDGQSSFEHAEFRFLIETGIRLELDSNIDVRARMAESLRRARPGLGRAARQIIPDVLGTIEDIDSSLSEVGAVVRAYTNHLFEELQGVPDTKAEEIEAMAAIADWRASHLDWSGLLERLTKLEARAVGPIANLLFESEGDAVLAEAALEALSTMPFPVTARVLAHAVSEPLLEERQEAAVMERLRRSWPSPRTYILYRLRQHAHEDIPFRWLELLVDMKETCAIDRILEEVVSHASEEDYRQDLLAIFGLIDRSDDPGRTGKVLRLMTEESSAEAVLDVMEDALAESSVSQEVGEALERWTNGHTILIPRSDDFNSFAVRHAGRGVREVLQDWDSAYHETLGWRQRSAFPRGPIETEFEAKLQAAMMRELSLNPGLDDDLLRNQIESFRERQMVTPKDGILPLVAIYGERLSCVDPWMEEIYAREINEWYIQAAQYVDEGDLTRGRQYLDMVLEIDPEYSLAIALRRVLAEI